MTLFFDKSRRLVCILAPILGVCGAIIGWLLPQGRIEGAAGRALMAVLCAVVAVSLAFYAARLSSMKEYQARLLCLYEELDPEKFLEAMLPLAERKMDASLRGTVMAHIANGYLYAGRFQEALEALDSIQAPEKALEMRGLVLGNKAACCLMAEKLDQAREEIDALRGLITDKACKKEFVQKARHTIAYLELCLAVHSGKKVDVSVLEKDFSASRSPLHKLDVQYQLGLYYRLRSKEEPYRAALDYVRSNGGRTALPALLTAET